MDEFQFHHQGRVVEETRHGRERTLGDCCIKSNSTLVMTKMGLVLNVTNPKVGKAVMSLEEGSDRGGKG